MPEEERYDGYIQLENGVGMLRLLETEIEEALGELHRQEAGAGAVRDAAALSIATGRLALSLYSRSMWEPDLQNDIPAAGRFRFTPFSNDFFGEMITVSGLITGGRPNPPAERAERWETGCSFR